MEFKKVDTAGESVAIVSSSKIVISDVQSALDLIATVHYETGCNRIILDKTLITESFFDLKTRLAGEILQKFINYHVKIAIIGDFSVYTSKSLKDFIYESNNGKDIFFLPTQEQAIDRLGMLP